MRKAMAAVALALLTIGFLLFTAPTAGAEQGSTLPGGTGAKDQVALASTGLDITTPVVIGLCTLVVGIILVSWAFLRSGSAHRHH